MIQFSGPPALAASPDASPLTPVRPSTASEAADTGAARTQAIASMVSAANHAVIQRVATGSVDVPELGRVAVRAASLGGRVDVDVASDRPETRAMLHAASGAMASDLRQADVPLRHLRFDGGGAETTTPDRSQRERGTDRPPPRHDPLDADVEEEPLAVAPLSSVRIVL